MKSMAQIAYEAFSRFNGGMSPVTGCSYAKWADLPSNVQQQWNEAAVAVNNLVKEEIYSRYVVSVK